MCKVLITTVPFAKQNKLPLELLAGMNVELLINPLHKKLTENELVNMVADFDIIIAGTEPITQKVMEAGRNLKLISRVGIGLDSVDLLAAEKMGITVAYTPEAPAPAVAELTIGAMLTLLRSTHLSNSQMHKGVWHRYLGRRLSEVTIGIIGVGRIGERILNHLEGFGCRRILINDLVQRADIEQKFSVEWVSKEEIYEEADIITLHLPLTHMTRDLICSKQLLAMKKDALLINTSRGGIVNEQDLYDVMASQHLGGAAIDVFEQEPYNGPLNKIEKCLLTAHMGSMSVDCRSSMEIQATQEVQRFLAGNELKSRVPNEEYEIQRQKVK